MRCVTEWIESDDGGRVRLVVRLYGTNVGVDKERREEVLRQLCVVQGKVAVTCVRKSSSSDHHVISSTSVPRLTQIQTGETGAIQRQRLVVLLVLLLDREPHEHEVEHVADAVEREAQGLLPDRVEPVVLHDAGLDGHRARGRARDGGGRRGGRGVGAVGGGGREEGRVCPVGDVDGDLDEGVQDGLVDDLAAESVFRAWQLLCGDDL